MAFLAAAARGAAGMARSGLMRAGMGDAKAGEATEQLKKVKEIKKKLESGEISIKNLNGDLLRKFEGKDFLEKFEDKFGKKSFNPYREMAKEKEGQDRTIEWSEKKVGEQRSFKSGINGSFDITKSMAYDNRLLNIEGVKPMSTYTPEPGPGEMSLEGGPLRGDIKKLETDGNKFLNDLEKGKDISKDLKALEKDVKNLLKDAEKDIDQGLGQKFGERFANDLKSLEQDFDKIANDLEKNGKISAEDLNNLEKDEEKLAKDIGQNEDGDESGHSIEPKSFLKKVKDVIKTLKEYERIVGEDSKEADTLKNIDVITDFQSNSTSSQGSQRLSRNHAYQNARRTLSKGGSFSKTGTGGVHHSTAGGPQSGSSLKLGSYDPSRGQVSKGWSHKALDPVRNFYNKHEKWFDAASNLNNQFQQANDSTSVIIDLMEKVVKEDTGVDIPVEGGSQNNQANQNNSDSLLADHVKKKMGFGKEHEHKALSKGRGKLALAENIASKKGGNLKNLEHKSNLKTLETKDTTAKSSPWKDFKEPTNKVLDFFRKIDEKLDKYHVKAINDTFQQAANNFQDPIMELIEKWARNSGIEIPEEQGPQNKNGSSILDGVLSSKGDKKKPVSAKSNEKSSLGHYSNSKTAMVELHKGQTAVVELHSETPHTIDIEPSKGNQPKISRKNPGFFKTANDQPHPHPQESDILLHKEGPNTPEIIKAEKTLKTEGENENLHEEHTKETLDKLEVINNIVNLMSKNGDKQENDARQQENTEKQQEEVKLKEEREQLKVIQEYESLINQDGEISASRKKIVAEAEILVGQIRENGGDRNQSKGEEARQQKIVAQAEILEEQIQNKEETVQQDDGEKARQKAKVEVVEEQPPKYEEIVKQGEGEKASQEAKVEVVERQLSKDQYQMDTFDEMKAILREWDNQRLLTWITNDQSASQEVSQSWQSNKREQREPEKVKAGVEESRERQDQAEVRATNQLASQEVPQTVQPDERGLEKVKVEAREAGEVQGVQKQNNLENLQVQINALENSEDFLLEKKASDLNAIRRQTDNRIVAKTTEAMLPPDNEPSRRSSSTDPIANKMGGTESHTLNLEDINSLEEFSARFTSRMENKINLKNENKVDKNSEEASVKPGEQDPVSKAGDYTRDQVEIKIGEKAEHILRAEESGSEERKSNSRVETEDLAARANAGSEISKLSEPEVAGAVTETDQKPKKENTSETIEQVRKPEYEVYSDNIGNEVVNQDRSQIEHQETIQNNKNIDKMTERTKDLEGAKKLKSERTEFSGNINDAEKAKLEFVNSFGIERLPAELHEIAKKLAEDVYDDAQRRKIDIHQVKAQFQEQLKDDNFRGNFIKGLYQEKAIREEEANRRNRSQWQNEAPPAVGIEVY